jgi:phage tail-like protein
VIINLLNEKASPMMTWTLTNAFPVKMQATDLKSDASEVAIETLELAYETLAVKAA